jgi:diguanylate cyclase (GGDEF)-like protein
MEVDRSSAARRMPQTIDGASTSFRERLAALAFGALVLAAGVVTVERIHDIESRHADEVRRNALLQKAAAMRARLERELNATLFITSGLVGYVSAYDDLMESERVTAALAAIYRNGEHVRNVAMAPDNVIRYIYPVEGNDAAIGLDYRENDEQWPAVARAMRERRTVLSGPVDLVQGGRALIARTPVFLDGDRYWGVLSLVIDSGSLFDAAGLGAATAGLRSAVRWREPAGARGRSVCGSWPRSSEDPVALEISVPGGAWELAVSRGEAPSARAAGPSLFRWGGHAAALLVAVLAALLLEERRRISRMAMVDPLTGLANRRHFRRRLNALIGRGGRDDRAFALLYIDLDGFKEVNDAGGHGLGDRVLGEVAARMVAETRRTERLARLGGDEFALLMPDVRDRARARRRAAAIRAAIRRPFPEIEVPVYIDASIGIAMHPADGDDADALLRAADREMYDVKRVATGD